MTSELDALLISSFQQLQTVKFTISQAYTTALEVWPHALLSDCEGSCLGDRVHSLVSSLIRIAAELQDSFVQSERDNAALHEQIAQLRAKLSDCSGYSEDDILSTPDTGKKASSVTSPKLFSHSQTNSCGALQDLELQDKLPVIKKPLSCQKSYYSYESEGSEVEESAGFIETLVETRFKEQIDCLKLENQLLKSKLLIEAQMLPSEIIELPCVETDEVPPTSHNYPFRVFKKLLRRLVAHERSCLMHSYINIKYWRAN
jgi:hypothetical protein